MRGCSLLTCGFAVFSLVSCAGAAPSLGAPFPSPEVLQHCTLEDLRGMQLASRFSAADESRWFFSPEESRGTLILVHGLNNKPRVMDALAHFLTEKGFDVLRLGLTGHGESLTAFQEVTPKNWREDFQCAYSLARKRAPQKPLMLVGFSLGGLMGVDFLVRESAEKPLFDSVFLLAPAMFPRWYVSLFRGLTFFPSLVISSAAPQEYRAHRGTPVAAYLALLDVSAALVPTLKKRDTRLEFPLHVFMDERDKTVDFEATEAFVKQQKGGITKARAGEGRVGTAGYHLLVDEAALGSEEWGRLLGLLDKALEAHNPLRVP